ncbi:MAG: NADH:ubiquinone reductase (Na(+)-transporting) subunit C [Bacteroidales bacterium]|nr:NADH:ubiquinone reductase (Na(+)-transporting) subunit C [Bacteroidales bacterium]
MNTNSNTYTILYACGVVIIVAFLLAYVSSALKAPSEANERIDQQKQILASLNLRPDKKDVEAKFKEVVVADPIVDTTGAELKADGGFNVARKEIAATNLPVYVCNVDGETKYVLPLVGKGLWGTIWGYLAINDDCETIYGAYFSHESETAGLGALIADQPFQDKFKGKKIHDGAGNYLKVVKFGAKQDNPDIECDGISGATLTINGVSSMLHDYLKMYQNYLLSKKK